MMYLVGQDLQKTYLVKARQHLNWKLNSGQGLLGVIQTLPFNDMAIPIGKASAKAASLKPIGRPRDLFYRSRCGRADSILTHLRMAILCNAPTTPHRQLDLPKRSGCSVFSTFRLCLINPPTPTIVREVSKSKSLLKA